jgi:hypothetical protein
MVEKYIYHDKNNKIKQNSTLITILVITIFASKEYFEKKKKNGGIPVKVKIKDNKKYSKTGILLTFNSEINFILIK